MNVLFLSIKGYIVKRMNKALISNSLQITDGRKCFYTWLWLKQLLKADL
nr:MAG TPA: hypothetical protein [Caudoviricetes sp.]